MPSVLNPRTLIRIVLAFVLGLCSLSALAVNPDDLLPPERAFALTATRQGDTVTLDWRIADGYYLYKERIRVATEPVLELGTTLADGTLKQDAFFGRSEIYHGRSQATVTLPAGAPRPLVLVVSQQGCADAGVCYPPETRRLTLGADGVPAGGEQGDDLLSRFVSAAGLGSAPATPAAAPADTGGLAKLGWIALLGSFFVAGLGLAFTACLYPMLPIVSAIVAGQGEAAHGWRGFALAMAYVQGLALTYTVVGVAAGLTGSLLTVWLQRPEVAIVAAVLLLVFALAMFEVINVQLPASLQARMASASNRMTGGRLLSVFAMGALSALIVGPCVAPPLAVALGYIGASGDAVRGGAALYAMALGLGAPLLLLGAAGGKLLPKAGGWMQAVKGVFGVLMLLLAIYLLSPWLPAPVALLGYGVVLVGAAVFAGACDALPAGHHGGRRFLKLLGLLAAITGVIQLVGGLAGADDPLRPLLPLTARASAATVTVSHPAFTRVDSPADWERFLAANRGRPVMLDFYADWCVSCKEMERDTFSDPRVATALGKFALAQADVTANSPAHQQLLKNFGLYGPPGTIFFDIKGMERDRVIGYLPPSPFFDRVQALLR